MSARQELAEAIAALLPDTVRVIDHPRELDAIPGDVRAVVMISRTAVRPGSNSMGALAQAFELLVIEPTTEPGGSEDSLDEITDELIEIFEELTWVAWSEATRSTYAKRYPTYKFDLTAATTITKKE